MKATVGELRLVEQTAPGSEMQHGRSVHLALKNGAFSVRLETATVSMLSCPVVASLFYDDMKREVVTAKTAPLVSKTTVSSDGKSVTVECRIKVLSSAHEDSNFRVRFRVLDGATGKPFEPDAVVFSEPVRIVSKPEQLTGKAAGPTETVARPQKLRSEYVEQLERIRDAQRDQVTILRRIVAAREQELVAQGRGGDVIAQNEFLPPNYAALGPVVAAAPTKKKAARRKKMEDEEDDDEEEEESRPARRKKSKKALAEEEEQRQQQQQRGEGNQNAFDGAFFRFIASFNDLRPGAKVEQLRKALQQAKPAKAALWQNFLTLIIQESKAAVETVKGPPVDMCSCEGCPYRTQVVNFDLMFDAPRHIEDEDDL